MSGVSVKTEWEQLQEKQLSELHEQEAIWLASLYAAQPEPTIVMKKYYQLEVQVER